MARNRDDDPQGSRGGDTGQADQKGQGAQAEKGDQRRDKPTHSDPTRGGTKGTTNRRSKRSGSDSNDSKPGS